MPAGVWAIAAGAACSLRSSSAQAHTLSALSTSSRSGIGRSGSSGTGSSFSVKMAAGCRPLSRASTKVAFAAESSRSWPCPTRWTKCFRCTKWPHSVTHEHCLCVFLDRREGFIKGSHVLFKDFDKKICTNLNFVRRWTYEIYDAYRKRGFTLSGAKVATKHGLDRSPPVVGARGPPRSHERPCHHEGPS